ncbi:aspartyl protease family protein [Nodularia harveyana UHCC-0300]|uniref:Aspartyl protease family protein n=1 Tax=Nodularia harveyana UHCC-0300 TaxID=2974287 RepID=A0ABU5UJ02_9CYAN|nr:aspartyl protease family protein [Nodularia harveyana]MEA5583552.1 aspartyl protease family protein [Nodularia harveyana UHCC-0300]
MVDAQRFPYKIIDSSLGMVDRMPHLPLTLGYNDHSLKVEGLLDTGASVNVLPYEIGKQLGFIWENETLSVILAGNLAQFEARAVVVDAQVGSFPTINLAFAWTQATNVPLILGQANFFFEFDVCFFRARSEFEIRPKRVD